MAGAAPEAYGRTCFPVPGASSVEKEISMSRSLPLNLSRNWLASVLAGALLLAMSAAPTRAQDFRHDDGDVIATYYQNFHVFSGLFLRRLVDNGTASKSTNQ